MFDVLYLHFYVKDSLCSVAVVNFVYVPCTVLHVSVSAYFSKYQYLNNVQPIQLYLI